jgi:bilin biosynthesis protein
MAFLPAGSYVARPGSLRAPAITVRRVRVVLSRRRRASLSHITANYDEKLAQLTCDIDHDTTDRLVSFVESKLDSGEAVGAAELEELVVHLGDSRGMSRLALVEAFGRVGSPAVGVLLTGLKTCPNPVVRRSCAKALAKIGDDAATDTLIETLLSDEDSVTRASSAGALAKMGSSAVPKLLALISSPESGMTAQGHAAWAISFMQGTASKALFHRAQDPSPNVRLAVISAMGSIAIGNALPTLSGDDGADDWISDALDEKEVDLSEQRERAISILCSGLDDENAEVRGEAATALANVGVHHVCPKILTFLDDDDLELRRTAALAIMKLGYTDGISRLEELANDDSESSSVRNVARLAAKNLARASTHALGAGPSGILG